MNEFNNNNFFNFNNTQENSWGNNSYSDNSWGNVYTENNFPQNNLGNNSYPQNNNYNPNNNANYPTAGTSNSYTGYTYMQDNGYTANSYSSNFNGNNQSSYNSNYNGADNYNQNQNDYVEPGYPYEYQYRFSSAYFNYKVPENPYTVCIKPKMNIPLLILLAPFWLIPVFVVVVIILGLLMTVNSEVISVLDFVIKSLPAIFLLWFVFILLSVTVFPVIERHNLKRRCNTKVKGIIKAVGYINPYKESSGCVPLYNFFYQGKDYYFEGHQSLFKKYEAGSEVEVFINENDPTECYVATDDKASNRLTIILILVIVAIAFFIGSAILK